MIENCPAEVRYSGIAFSYNLGMALFGGTTPLVITLLTERFGLLAPAYYLMIMASISLIAVLFMEPNQQNIIFTTPR
jgi:MHS family proline/betaine transporter-like MFS transporter